MKKIIYLSLALSLAIISCESTPEAYFYTDTDEPEVGQKVYFSNDSQNAERFEWDFGDGFISNEVHPVHIFNSTGTYEVTLTAISKNNLEDVAALTLTVMIPTLLEIEVLEYFDEYPVGNASVILYPTLSDWDGQTNMVSEGFTDVDGFVVFSNLDNDDYFVDVWEATHDNYALRDENEEWIRTLDVLPHKINKFIAWVDYVEHTKGNARGTREVIIKKFERKADTKRQPDSDTGTEGWQELYSRSIGKK